MKLKLITTCDKQTGEGFLRMKNSCEANGWEIEVIEHPFEFGKQLQVIKNWINNYTGDATHLIYIDAFDNICFGGPDEAVRKLEAFGKPFVISAEKNCYPHPERAKDYPQVESAWKYVNGGGWIGEIEYIKNLLNENLKPDSHDQIWLMEMFLANQGEITLDYNCKIFQTIAFCFEMEFIRTEDRWINIRHETMPIFFHGNGHTPMEWLC